MVWVKCCIWDFCRHGNHDSQYFVGSLSSSYVPIYYLPEYIVLLCYSKKLKKYSWICLGICFQQVFFFKNNSRGKELKERNETKQKTLYPKGQWPQMTLYNLWPNFCWGYKCDSSQETLHCAQVHIQLTTWIQWPFSKL